MSSPSSSEPSSSSHLNSLQITKEGIQTTSSHTRSDSNSDEDAAALIDTSNQEARQNQTVGSDSEAEDPTSGKRKRKRIHFNVEQLQTVYHLPLKTAAERLGICEAALKRICRRNHVHKWPYRQLSSVRRRIAELKNRYAVVISGTEGGGRMDMVTLEVAHSVLGRTGAPPVVRDERSHRDSVSVTPAQFHDKLRQLEEEKDHIILSAHQHNCPDTVQSSQLIMADTLTPHLHDRQNNLPLLDLNQFDRDFPLLFLANVCESVQAYH